MKSGSKRRGHSTTLAAALALAACLGQGSGSSSGYPGASGGGSAPPPQRPGQPPSGGYPPQSQYQQQQQQQQQQYRPGPGQGQGPSSSSQGPPPSGPGGAGGGAVAGGSGGGPPSQQQDYYGRGARPMGHQQQPQPSGYRGGPPSQNQPYGQAPGGGGGGGGGYGGGGYPGGQPQQPGGYGGRSPYSPPGMQPHQQPQQPSGGDGGGLLSRLTNKLKGMDGPPGGGGQAGQGYGSGGGRYGAGSQQYPPQGPQDWQQQPQQPRPGMALQPTGPRRGLTNLAPSPTGYHPQRQDDAYGGGQPRHPSSQPHPQDQQPAVGGGGGDGPGIWSRFKGKVFQGDANGDSDEGPPSFRPGGSVLKKKDDVSVANSNPPAFGGPGAYGNPFPTFPGPPGMAMGQANGAVAEPSGPGVAEVTSVDGSIVMVLKPNELTKKKRKFKQDGANRLQVVATFDHCLTAFNAKDGKTPCLKTTDALEQNELVMLPEAAKKVRFLRSDFKRRMEADGKTMTPDERVAALEDNLRKVYSTVAMEGGVHMNSIGPAIESQLDNIPLRDGVDDMTAALAWRAIPLTIFCAGYGNVAMEVLRRGSPKISGPGGVFTPHLRLVANFFKPDDTMTIIGMYDTVPLIHEAKKSGATLMEFLRGVRQENAFASRPNVLLLGSELSDLGLGNGLPGVEERISVGFLKLDEHVLDKLPRYAQAYDVLIIGDGDMSYANEILHEVVG